MTTPSKLNQTRFASLNQKAIPDGYRITYRQRFAQQMLYFVRRVSTISVTEITPVQTKTACTRADSTRSIFFICSGKTLCQRPVNVLSQHLIGLHAPRLKRLLDSVVTPGAQRVAHGHRDIAQPALVPYAAYRTALREFQKFSFTPGEQGDQLLARQTCTLVEIRQGTALGKLVPGAGQLTIIAAVDAVPHQ